MIFLIILVNFIIKGVSLSLAMNCYPLRFHKSFTNWWSSL